MGQPVGGQRRKRAKTERNARARILLCTVGSTWYTSTYMRGRFALRRPGGAPYLIEFPLRGEHRRPLFLSLGVRLQVFCVLSCSRRVLDILVPFWLQNHLSSLAGCLSKFIFGLHFGSNLSPFWRNEKDAKKEGGDPKIFWGSILGGFWLQNRLWAVSFFG